jgi:hypothetical protein
MKTFTQIAIAALTMVGIASAQPAPAPKTGSAAPPAGAKTPGPSTPAAGAKTGAGAAAPGAKADPKAGATAPGAKADPKAATPAAGAADAKAAAVKPPAPPAEIKEALKTQGGNWRCTGEAADPSGQMTAMKGTMRTKADLDGWWIQDSFTGTMGKAKYKQTAYTTYDAASKKWRRISVDNMGGQAIGTSDGFKEGKATYNMDTMGAMGNAMFRDNVDMSDKKAGVKVSGEMSMDKGKTWTKVYEATCKR